MTELSVVVPVLNEAAALPAFFAMLGRQQGIAFEVLLADGGSTDGTLEVAGELAAAAPFPCRLIRAPQGRARQQNAGAAEAKADLLLFLHADCAFPDPMALRRGVDTLAAALTRRGDDQAAGRFALRFDLPPGRYGAGYYFYECKARLGRPECIYGDQGFLLRRSFFASLGGFDLSLPLMEDGRLAEAVRRQGAWLLLPEEIVTSARRFEAEGLAARQTLNALLTNFAAIGWTDFFGAAAGLYRTQDRTRRLRLGPYFRTVRELLRPLPATRRRELWYATGRYVRGHAWQLPFALDARRAFRRGLPPGAGPTPALAAHDRWFDRLTDHPPGRLATTVLVWVWFHLCCLRTRLFE